MAIQYHQTTRIFTLQTAHTTYQMKVDAYGFLLHLYYGGKISGDMDYLLTYYDRGFSGNPSDVKNDRTYSLDMLPQEYAVMGTGDYRNHALVIRNGDGSDCCDLRYVSHAVRDGKYGLSGLPAVFATEREAQTLEIVLEDPVSHVQARLLYGVLWEEDVITRSAVIVNQGETEIVVEKAASACLDFIAGDYDLISFYGRHAMERNFQRTPVVHGTQAVGSRRGTSSHQYNPAVIVAGRETTEDAGGCYGLMFVYSGSFMCEAERDQYDQTRIVMGLQSDQFHYPLGRGETLTVPETVLCYSGQGLGTLSRRYHSLILNHLIRGKYGRMSRPVLINSWEASYFDFSGETILALAREAADLGIDMVVMDDGWFGKRPDDNSGLGDWQVNEEKLGCTLGELTGKVNDLGVKFGIWIEPEMISEDSDLYRKHPDWVMRIPGRKPVYGRNQLVLDFSRKEVRDAVFDQICAVLDQGNIEYVKWDMNRSIADVYSMRPAGRPEKDIGRPEKDSGRAGEAACRPASSPGLERTARYQGRVAYDYVLGVYDFLERLIARYPDMLIEGCSGGGGRFDAGMMYYTPQIWCSDNTDAVDRIRIQYGTSFFYPVSVMGSHVSAVPNHQTGRSTSLRTRGLVAMAGTFGYELDPAKLTPEEREEIREQIRIYKKYEPVIRRGSYYRLSDPYRDAYAAWMFVSEDRAQALLCAVMLENHGNMTVNYVKFRGLKPDAVYEDLRTHRRHSGSALMEAGIPMPVEPGEYLAYGMELVMV